MYTLYTLESTIILVAIIVDIHVHVTTLSIIFVDVDYLSDSNCSTLVMN